MTPAGGATAAGARSPDDARPAVDAIAVTDGTAGEHELIEQFRRIAGVSIAAPAPAQPRTTRWLGVYRWVLAIAAGKVAAALAAYAVVRPGIVQWPVVANALVFGISGAMLIVGGSRDRRVRRLGGLFLLIGSAFSDPLLPTATFPLTIPLVALFHALATDAFLAFGLWSFIAEFPSAAIDGHLYQRAARATHVTAGLVGAALLTLNLLGIWWPTSIVVHAFTRNSPTSAYWPVLFGTAVPAIPYLLWKARRDTIDNRRRAAVFVLALSVAVTPMVAAVMVSSFVTAVPDAGLRARVGLLLYAALVSLIPATAYAVMVDRVMDVDLVIRKAAQYALARSVVTLASVLPLAFVAVDLYGHRDLSLEEYVVHLAWPGLVASLIGLGLAFGRQRILVGVDRRFQRAPANYTHVVARLTRSYRTSRSLRDLVDVLEREILQAVHPTAVDVLLVDSGEGSLVAVSDRTCSLAGRSFLVEFLARSEEALDIGPAALPRHLLGPSDQSWLARNDHVLLLPLRASTGSLIGVIALGPRRNEMAYSAADREIVTAVASQTALHLENLWLRESQDQGAPRVDGSASSVQWQHEPAIYCRTCGAILAANTRVCSCGGAVAPAALPRVLNGKFRVQQFIGAGGNGVVYRAVDIALNRNVAIKTLPSISEVQTRRLRREARAMAAVLHPNLALIYAVEQWRGTPILVVEYLEGGTLLDLIRRRQPTIPEIVDLGIILADVLDRLHGCDVLHRDIKPSNIGFTAAGVPKLLDFGLAAIVHTSDGAGSGARAGDECFAAALDAPTLSATSLTATRAVVGTPLYLSPESAAGLPPQPSVDLWSLGLVLYQALAGRHPLADATARQLLRQIRTADIPDVREYRDDCPAPLAALLRDALDRDIRRRPANAGVFRMRLRRLDFS